MPLAQFAPFVSQVAPSFWNTLSSLKLNEYQLSDELIPARAEYGTSKTIVDRLSGSEMGLGCRIHLDGRSIDTQKSLVDFCVDAKSTSPSMYGYIKNFNTLQEFKVADKKMFMNQVADEIWDSFTGATSSLASVNNPNLFLLLTYADLKSFKYYYWFAFPALLARKPGWMVEAAEGGPWVSAPTVLGEDAMYEIGAALLEQRQTNACFVSIYTQADQSIAVRLWTLEQGEAYMDAVPQEERILLFIDPSPYPQSPGWPLRNILTSLQLRLGMIRVHTLCWKDMLEWDSFRITAEERALRNKEWKSVFGLIYLEASSASDGTVLFGSRNTNLVVRPDSHPPRPEAVGWERNAQGKLLPKLASLGAMLDPRYLAENAVDLNLKLMRWRVIPELALETIQHADTLLIGAGTLGCNVARTLLGWGVRKITLVDNGRVAFSNPVRQPLYEFDECLDGGQPKAVAAAAALKRIFPGVDAQGFHLSVPMPGHPIPPASMDKALEDIAVLEKLIEQHDVIFLLTDSREARWFPSLVGAARRKLVLNAALAYDSFVVMRHGVNRLGRAQLGCYFCNDVVAPGDSLTNRTLDQMCTVTRPGIAGIAASIAVELMVSVLQHPLAAGAPAPTGGDADESETELGIVPHQIRGSLRAFSITTVANEAFDHCTACSDEVIAAYEREGSALVVEACNDPAYLEHITHLDDLKHDTDALELELDWSDEEAEGLQ
ncbi:Atg7p [Malassezia vespertilionis]|uniref:Ubiquitin-like modifier-activating enzyme ATG7 n=1 Tax=Malassezia vespertilionis TaxID=2020962 RepID=A0A2N1JFS5_9BASI|nr:Atg7p [Malassezia vespertilionis]